MSNLALLKICLWPWGIKKWESILHGAPSLTDMSQRKLAPPLSSESESYSEIENLFVDSGLARTPMSLAFLKAARIELIAEQAGIFTDEEKQSIQLMAEIKLKGLGIEKSDAAVGYDNEMKRAINALSPAEKALFFACTSFLANQQYTSTGEASHARDFYNIAMYMVRDDSRKISAAIANERGTQQR